MRIPGGDVDFEWEWERPDGNTVTLQVTATISDYFPAVMYLRDGDPGYPAEGGEVEDLEVLLPDGTKMDVIPAELLSQLEDKAREEHFG